MIQATIRPVVGVYKPPPRPFQPIRKIALVGSHTESLRDAPWFDSTWEFWGHASSHAWYPRKIERYFDLHDKTRWSRATKKKGHDYPEWLKRVTVPIFMQEQYPEIPASWKYPKGLILTEFSYAHRRQYFTNHMAWMCALAIIEGVDHIGLYGINYQTQSEYERQRGCAEYWLGQCDARGIQVHLPEQCSLLNEPKSLYGYDSHDERGTLKDEYKRKEWKGSQDIVPGKPRTDLVVPPELMAQIKEEEKIFPRPEWAGPSIADRANGGCK